METPNNTLMCPVCFLFLREGVTMRDHLKSHNKSLIITALIMSTREQYQSEQIYNGADSSGEAKEDVVLDPIYDDPQSREVMDFVDTDEEIYDGTNSEQVEYVVLRPFGETIDTIDHEQIYDSANLGEVQLDVHDPDEIISVHDVVEEIVTINALGDMVVEDEYLH